MMLLSKSRNCLIQSNVTSAFNVGVRFELLMLIAKEPDGPARYSRAHDVSSEIEWASGNDTVPSLGQLRKRSIWGWSRTRREIGLRRTMIKARHSGSRSLTERASRVERG